MRVIAGTARSISLKTPDGMETRPTTDRIKETLFNMLHLSLADCEFLDLFSGSGAIGIEALSRGAKRAYFVEQNKVAIDCIRQNLAAVKLEDQAVVIQQDVLSAIHQLNSQHKAFDLIFMDPPYRQDWERKILSELKNTSILHKDTRIIIEAASDTKFDYIEDLGYFIQKTKQYKTNQHVFLTCKESSV